MWTTDGEQTVAPVEHTGEWSDAISFTGEASAAGLDAASGPNLEPAHRSFPRWTANGVGTL